MSHKNASVRTRDVGLFPLLLHQYHVNRACLGSAPTRSHKPGSPALTLTYKTSIVGCSQCPAGRGGTAVAPGRHWVSIWRWESDQKLSIEKQLWVGIQSISFTEVGLGNPLICRRHCPIWRFSHFLNNLARHVLLGRQLGWRRKNERQNELYFKRITN